MIKKYYRNLYRTWLGKPLSKDQFRYILSELLQINRGDSILVHCSFGNLKAGFSPSEAVEILMEVVGYEGNILMPYYPEDSVRWLEEGKVFDVRSTPTRSGILSSTFAKYPGVEKSLHPIKSLAAWGKDRNYLIDSHHESTTPYDRKSPYYKLLNLKNSKTIGIGTYKNSFIHCAEDITDNYPRYYYKNSFKGRCLDTNGNMITVNTYAHAPQNIPRFTGFILQTNCPDYEKYSYRNRIMYVGVCDAIVDHIKKCTKDGITPYMHFSQRNIVYRFLDNIRYKLNG